MRDRRTNPALWLIQTLLISAMLAACAPAAGLSCPITRDQMQNPQEDWPVLMVENQSCISFCAMYIAPSACDDWGYDWLGEDSLPAGEQWSVQLPAGRYDLQMMDCTGIEYIWEKLDVREDMSFELTASEPAAAACPHSLIVVNQSEEAVCHLWIAGPHSESFGWNWLGEDSIPAGESKTVIVPSGTYGLKAEGCGFSLLKVEMQVPVSGEVIWVIDPD